MYNFATQNLPSNFDNYFVKNSAFHRHATRSAQLFRLAVFKYNLARCTIRTQGPSLWNSLPDNIQGGGPVKLDSMWQHRLTRLVRDRYMYSIRITV